MTTPNDIPVIDVSALIARTVAHEARAAVAQAAHQIGQACRAHGFFYVRGHGVPAELVARLDRLSRRFFALDEPTKLRWRIALGGRAWRGYFPTGGELTSGRPDWKEGLYLGTELPDDDPRVQARWPVHGHNLFPDVPGLREAILEYIAALTALGHRLMEGMRSAWACRPATSPSAIPATRWCCSASSTTPRSHCRRRWMRRPTPSGAWASTPTMACLRCCCKTTWVACK
ncbi:MAG TPA: 2-oxoglutarate and iron-dependent oxygenase domain-containing protein [Burkholderiaceae bacterium]